MIRFLFSRPLRRSVPFRQRQRSTVVPLLRLYVELSELKNIVTGGL